MLLGSSLLHRDEIEKDLEFAGLLIMQNTLKDATIGALQKLNKAKINSIMVTGDNPRTACYVAVACKMVSPEKSIYISHVEPGQGVLWQDINDSRAAPLELFSLLYGTNSLPLGGPNKIQNSTYDLINKVDSSVELAVTGTAFEILQKSPHEFQAVLKHAHVYARMKPDQKQFLVESLEQTGLTVGMCGDGANDCGALKAADVGISLSEAEASIAAPFTSAVPNIGCVSRLLRDGRCALVTSFQAFKFMASYSLIQFTTCMILYTIAAMLSDFEFLWIDLFVVMPLAFASEFTGPHSDLTDRRPTATLMGWNVISSLLAQNAINIAFQIGSYALLLTQDWHVKPPIIPGQENSGTAEVTTLFLVANFQYITSVFSYSVGKPYRKPFYSNSK